MSPPVGEMPKAERALSPTLPRGGGGGSVSPRGGDAEGREGRPLPSPPPPRGRGPDVSPRGGDAEGREGPRLRENERRTLQSSLFAMTDAPTPHTYAESGVDADAAAAGLSGLLAWVRETRDFREGAGEQIVPNGFFASVLRLTDRLSLAISTDGVGSKSVLAQLVGDFEAIGWDCVAVNVNDVVCVGAQPFALVDYIALQFPHEDLLSGLGKGMRAAAERARVAIVGGELSQHPDTLAGPRPGYAFDISGTCVGLLDGAAPITGARIEPGDVVVGMPSNGVHANGLTLARSVFLRDDPAAVARALPECGRTVGEELLRPTRIYVPEALAMIAAGVDVRGLAHISGDGLLNLLRLDAEVEYRLDALPPVPPVFEVIRREGNVALPEMHRVYNMGVGFCAVVPARDADAALEAIGGAGGEASVIGMVREGARRVVLPAQGLVGAAGVFAPGA